MNILKNKSGFVGFKSKYPDLHEEAYQAGVKAERARVAELLSLQRRVPRSNEVVMEAIISGKDVSDIEPKLTGKALRDGTYGADDEEDASPERVAEFVARMPKI